MSIRIGIITDPASTFRIGEKKKSVSFDIYNVPDEMKMRKMSFNEYFSGNYLEIKTLKEELSDLGDVEIVIFTDGGFVHESSKMTISELFRGDHSDFNLIKWMDGMDVLIVTIGKSNLKRFLNTIRMPYTKKIVVSSGRDDRDLFEKIDLYLKRVGVARFGKKNRERIRQMLERMKYE